jgi:uncharacterized protein (DUF1501 family)
VVFLRGAYDAANVVIPVGSDFYYAVAADPGDRQARSGQSQRRAAARRRLGPASGAADSIYPLWEGQVAFVPFAGTDDLTRSHFETQDTIELGQPMCRGSRNYRLRLHEPAGQLGAAHAASADRLHRPAAADLPRRRADPEHRDQRVGKPGVDDRQAKLIEACTRQAARRFGLGGLPVRDEVYRSISEEMVAANRGAVSPKGFELSARRIGRLMRDQFNLGFVDVGGWDTHVNQGAPPAISPAASASSAAAWPASPTRSGRPAWNDTVVVVISEFGRTFRENGDKGTDHGHGSVYWVMGGGIKGGRIAGEQVKTASTRRRCFRTATIRC